MDLYLDFLDSFVVPADFDENGTYIGVNYTPAELAGDLESQLFGTAWMTTIAIVAFKFVFAFLIWMPELTYAIWGWFDPTIYTQSMFANFFAYLATGGLGAFIPTTDAISQAPWVVTVSWFFQVWLTLFFWTFLLPPLYKYGALAGFLIMITMVSFDMAAMYGDESDYSGEWKKNWGDQQQSWNNWNSWSN